MQNSELNTNQSDKKISQIQEIVDILHLQPSLAEVALQLDISEDTVERRIKKAFGKTFKELRELHRFPIKQKLIHRAVDMAMKGNTTMMIFCLKNYCGWTDRAQGFEESHNSAIRIVVDAADLTL